MDGTVWLSNDKVINGTIFLMCKYIDVFVLKHITFFAEERVDVINI